MLQSTAGSSRPSHRGLHAGYGCRTAPLCSRPDTVSRVVEYRGTIHSQAFDLALQPIVDLRAWRLHHDELLARFDDGRSPFEMVTFAERLGVVAEFDLTVSRRALELLGEPALTWAGLAVDLSGRSLESEGFARALLAMLDERAAPRRRLLFEVTESAAIRQPEPVEKVLAALRGRGAQICLDDFGSGAAAFYYLRAFRFDYIKIDGDYIESTDQWGQAILCGIIGLCRERGVKTVAALVGPPFRRGASGACGSILVRGTCSVGLARYRPSAPHAVNRLVASPIVPWTR